MDIDIAAVRRNLRARAERERAERERLREAAECAVTEAARRLAPASPAARVYLFGSVIRPGAFRRDSDVDVAVEGLGAEAFSALWKALEAAAPDWLIDLRDLGADADFAARVRATGKLIYERSDPDPQS